MRATALLLALLGLTLLIAPMAGAVEFPFGSAVGSNDYDLTPVPSTGAADLRYALCLIDSDGDGMAGPNDYLLLMVKPAVTGTCPASVQANPATAYALNSNGGLVAGTEIKKNMDLSTLGLTTGPGAPAQLVHAIRYFEDGTDTSKVDGKDMIYLDLTNLASLTVSVGDLRLSPVVAPSGAILPSGTFVQSGDPDLARGLLEIKPATAPATKLVSSPNMVYKAGSGFYINVDAGVIMGVTGTVVDGDVGVESGDIRLNLKAVTPLTDPAIIGPDRIELVQTKVAAGQPFQVKIVAKNTGTGPGAGFIETRIDDTVMDARGTPTLAPNGVAVLVVTLVAPTTPGQHLVKSGTFVDFLTVTAGGSSGSGSDTAGLQSQISALQSQVTALQSASKVKPTTGAIGAPGLTPSLVIVALALLAVAVRRGK